MGMTREDAIKHLENMKWLLGVNNTTVDDIPLTKVIDDIAALLKAQEPVEPTLDIRHGKSMWRCGSCSTALQPNQIHTNFCFNCGQAVKWE